MSVDFAQLLADIEASTLNDLASTGTKDFRVLMDEAVTLFEQFPLPDQTLAYAFLFGLLTASIEGETSEGERRLGLIIGFEERLQMFCAVARAVFKDAMANRPSFDAGYDEATGQRQKVQ